METADRSVLDNELDIPLSAGGGMFCGVTEERFAINGVTYQWPKGAKLTWALGFSRLGPLSDMDVKDAFTAALKEISSCCDCSHDLNPNFNAAQIYVITQRLDGASGVLADCEIPTSVNPSTRLRMRLDDSENWVLAENPPQGSIDLYRVVLHELLHGHGLGHKPPSIQQPALISPVYSPSMRHLQQADKDELVRRYGPPKPVVTPPPPVIPVPGANPIILTTSSVIEQGGKKWKAETKTELTRVV